MQIASKHGLSVDKLISDKDLRSKIDLQEFITENIGMLTLKDIFDELEKPGRDPRKKFKTFKYDNTIKQISNLKTGMILNGIVTNITAFGAFVNLGIHESALLHKSQIANEFVSNPADYLRINQQIKVKILEVDLERKG